MNRLQPAVLTFNDDGTPFSERYGDVYHPRQGGPAQAEQVFISGNDLPRRWQDRDHFTILETGFGLGVNFLATWAAWRRDGGDCARLHFVSCELHPFSADDLRRAHAQWPQWQPLSSQLLQYWPELTPGIHRLHLDDGGVALTLLLGDARELLPQLQCKADAFYLDGFSPHNNPELWDEDVFAHLPRLAAPDATLATWSVSGTVRRGLSSVGFNCEKTPGVGAKREQLTARFTCKPPLSKTLPRSHHDMRAAVIGAGLAGSAMAHRLAERGWQVEVIDAGSGPAQGASGNLAGVLRPLPSLDDNRMARLTRAGTLYAIQHLRRLSAAGLPVRWDDCGVLHLARDGIQESRMQAVVARHDYPPSFLQYVTQTQAAEIAGWRLNSGGWWFPSSGWVNPPSLCAANLAAYPSRIVTRFARTVTTLQRENDEWHLMDAEGHLITRAPVVILASGAHVRTLAQAKTLAVRVARGQVSHLRHVAGPEVVVCRGGYVSPVIDGVLSVGASFAVDDDDLSSRLSDHRENLDKLAEMLPDHPAVASFEPEHLDGRTGLRPASPDRLPLVGQIPLGSAVKSSDTLENIECHPDLYTLAGYGARGLVWSALAAEMLASRLSEEPQPLERDLMQAMAPARYLLRNARRGRH